MDNALYYLALNRQVGLRAEMNAIANNLANADTTGFRKESTLFAEFVVAAPGGESVSMADGAVRFAADRPGQVAVTGARLDLAIEGDGFFLTEGDVGPLLTRAGGFQVSAEGFLVSSDGRRVLDAGQAPVFVPPDARTIEISPDGTFSADGIEQGRIGLFTAPSETLTRAGGAAFRPSDGVEPVADPRLRQGALERSNVDAIEEIARMMSVSRAYEQVQGLIRDEDERIRSSIQTLGEPV